MLADGMLDGGMLDGGMLDGGMLDGGLGVRRGLGVGRGRGGGAATVRTDVARATRPQSYSTMAEAVSVVPALIPGPRPTVTESPSAEWPGTVPQPQCRPSRPMRHEPPAPLSTAAIVVPADSDKLRCTNQASSGAGLAIETRYP
jgi:hypothetical protein